MNWLRTGMCGLLGLFFVVAGVNHFWNEAFYLKIMPPYIPGHRFWVAASGVAEVAAGLLLLVPATRAYGAWSIIAILLAVFPANIHVYQNQHLVPAPAWVHLLRLPVQGLLIYWAWCYTGSPRVSSESG